MIDTKIFGKHPNGENLIKTFSNKNLFIRKVSTNEIFEVAIDLESKVKTGDYEETDKEIPPMEELDI